ncbi:OmpA family protein [Prevotella dentasini]|uniref:OmpA family protein n=1 Tax=Prevotella dentasini TaxID=589537 RepID=UPI000468A139|nr:OmpA family protein [Prevotella dentasini]
MRKFLVALSMLVLGIGGTQAQVAYEKAKFLDNTYIGVEAGATTPMNLKSVTPLNGWGGLKLGKNFSPVFGANLEGLVSFGDNGLANSHTFARVVDLGLNGTVNLTNLFLGYNPQKTFEVIAEAGIGYEMILGDSYLKHGDDTELTAKTGLIFAWNLGADKAWQLYAEPAIIWNLTSGPEDAVRFDKGGAQLGLFVGVNYKFNTSNGIHNFKVWNVGELNDEINSLRNQLAAKPKQVVKEVIKEVVKEVPTTSTKEVRVENLVFVTFAQGKSLLTNDAKKALDEVKAGSHVQIVGTSSPEGSKELNDRLSQARANVVAYYLQNRGVVIDEATGKGVQGTTSNRLAIVYVK